LHESVEQHEPIEIENHEKEKKIIKVVLQWKSLQFELLIGKHNKEQMRMKLQKI
jgi:hypothetical protein